LTPLITKKSVHINLLVDTHAEFRVFCFKNGLSMQEVVEELVSKLVEGDPPLIRAVNKIKAKKNDPSANKVFSTDRESIYAELERDD